MEKSKILSVASILLILLGLLMIYLGCCFGAKIMYPPMVTGIGFIVIAWVFNAIK